MNSTSQPSKTSESADAADPCLYEKPSEQAKRHAAERAFLASRLATAAKPRLGRPALSAAAAAQQTAALEERIARETAALRAARVARGDPEEEVAVAASVAPAMLNAAKTTSLSPSVVVNLNATASAAAPVAPVAATPARLRAVETAALTAKLAPQGLEIFAVTGDGHCLFRAVAHQLSLLRGGAPAAAGSDADYRSLRARAATYIRLHADDFAPYLPYEPSDGYPAAPVPGSDAVHAAVSHYCERLATTSTWGGHPELKALSCTLGVPLLIFQAEGEPWRVAPTADRILSGAGSGATAPRPVRRARAREEYDGGDDDSAGGGVDDGGVSDDAALRLSFHRHFSAGEHFNSVVPMSSAARRL